VQTSSVLPRSNIRADLATVAWKGLGSARQVARHGAPRRSRSRFAVAETVPAGQRVLYFVEDQDEASELAAELRTRGVRAQAFRTRP